MSSNPHNTESSTESSTTPQDLRLREAVAADAAGITNVFLASRAAAMPYLPRLYSDEQTRAWIEAVVLPGSTVWVAETGEKPEIVGFAALDGTVLDHLYLRPDVRRQASARPSWPPSERPLRTSSRCTSSSATRRPAPSTSATLHRRGVGRRQPQRGERAGRDLHWTAL